MQAENGARKLIKARLDCNVPDGIVNVRDGGQLMTGSPQKASALIQVLQDPMAPFGDRHDAAMALDDYDGSEVEQALASVACDPAADSDLADACGESLAEIWARTNRFSEQVLATLSPSAKPIALATLKALSPSLFVSADMLLARDE